MSILICDHVASELWPKMSLSLSSRSGLHSVWNRLKDICWNVAELKVCYPISDSSPVKSEDREGGLMAARVTFSHSYQSPTRKCQQVNIFGTLFFTHFVVKLCRTGQIFTFLSNLNREVSASPLYPSQNLRRLTDPRPGGCKFQELSVKSVGQGGLLNAALAMEGGTAPQ